ncbi:MAG: hypothetical protein ACREOZ_00190 [Gloeomargaritales cyanobacterium]
MSYAEEIIVLAGKNLDDEKAGVAAAWAEAMARCICAVFDCGEQAVERK